MTRFGIVAALAFAFVVTPGLGLVSTNAAHAAPGFFVATGDAPLVDDATQVVLMRKGARTVVSVQPSYKGPDDAFAMVFPVPTALQERDVKVLDPLLFDAVDRLAAPRLLEVWEQDPCRPPVGEDAKGSPSNAAATDGDKVAKSYRDLGVTVDSKILAGAYQIVVLSAKDAGGLDAWLRREKYKLPAGADALLKPYVDRGMKFLVAKADPKQLKLLGGEDVVLPPLRFHYDSEQLVLPIRLGLVNSSGTQDLIVNILSPRQRYTVANVPSVTIPTNVGVKHDVRDKFAAFYAALFDATLGKHSGAVITEYVWDATTCEPCPGPTLDYAAFQALGGDVLEGPAASPTAYGSSDFVLTRMHARYGKSLADDLTFEEAPPIAGGRELSAPDGAIEQGAQASSGSAFQARYVIRHPWLGPLTCTSPVRGRWAGKGTVQVAQDLAYAPRGTLQLANAVTHDVPELELTIAGTQAATPTTTLARSPEKQSGCSSTGDTSGGLAIAVLLLLVRRRKR